MPCGNSEKKKLPVCVEGSSRGAHTFVCQVDSFENGTASGISLKGKIPARQKMDTFSEGFKSLFQREIQTTCASSSAETSRYYD